MVLIGVLRLSRSSFCKPSMDGHQVVAMLLKSRARIPQRLHGASYIQQLTLCFLAVHLDPSNSLSLSGKFRMQTFLHRSV
jgi:hypothetical protein